MPEWKAKGDWVIDGHVIRIEEGQTCGYPSRSLPPSVCIYADDYYNKLENGAPIVAEFGQTIGNFTSKIRSNPYTRAQQPTAWTPDA